MQLHFAASPRFVGSEPSNDELAARDALPQRPFQLEEQLGVELVCGASTLALTASCGTRSSSCPARHTTPKTRRPFLAPRALLLRPRVAAPMARSCRRGGSGTRNSEGFPVHFGEFADA
jgi:hypothetical protein